MSETVKTTTVYPDYYFLNFKFQLLPFVSIRCATITELYRTAKTGINRFIDIQADQRALLFPTF